MGDWNYWDADSRKLYYAAAWSDIERVQDILDRGNYDIDTQNPNNGNTPLYIASAWGSQNESTNFYYFDIAELLLHYGADVNLANDRGQTPLYIAAAWGHTNIVQLLIQSGAYLDADMIDGRTPLHIGALSAPHFNEWGMKYGNYTDGHKYHAYNLAMDYMQLMGNTGEYANYFTDLDEDYEMLMAYQPYPDEDVPDEIMDIAVSYNRFATVVELVQAGANLDITDNRQETPLTKAAYSGHLPLVKFLVDSGADINVVNYKNRSIADIAAGRNHMHVVEYFNDMEYPWY